MEADRQAESRPKAGNARWGGPRPRAVTVSGAARIPRWASPWWLILVGLALAETVALFVRTARVPSEADWHKAAQLVREAHESSDAVSVAPAWADPLLRLHLGDKITAKVAGRVDLAPFERLWVLSIRGARSPEAPPREPDLRRVIGRITVERYDFGPTPVVLDFVDALSSANVEITQAGQARACELRDRVGGAVRGGLGFGPAFPRQRFICDPKRPWLWVGTTILEDLSLSPRRCIWQHPQGREPVAVTFRGVHLGTRMVLYAGLDYHHERDERGAPVTLKVFADDEEIGRLVHVDGEGMKRIEIDTRRASRARDSARADVRFEVTTPNPHHRSFCWAGSIQDAVRREAP
jgi:hypothetical protein